MRIISIFARDFRLNDNVLFDGWKDNEIIPLFLFDDYNQNEHGENLKSLFFKYLDEFSKEIERLGSKLYIIDLRDFGKFLDVFKPDLVRHCFDSEPNASKKTNFLKAECDKRGIKLKTLFQFLILPTKEKFKKTFTNFYKKVFIPHLLQNKPILFSKPEFLITPKIKYECKPLPTKLKTDILKLWYKPEEEVLRGFDEFIEQRLPNYAKHRDFPFIDGTSKLSPYLRIGTISYKYVYLKAIELPYSDKFLSEIAWSEFYRIWLYLYPDVVSVEYRDSWRIFPWKYNLELFEKWKNGETGFEMVDAGMIQLKQEGWLHNRVRMIVASFLVKNLMIDWRWGEQYFYKNLVDADMAQNVGNWQWVAGCGLDASPHFRIFNPNLQLKKFDPERKYISKYLTEKHPQIIDFELSKREFLKAVRETFINH